MTKVINIETQNSKVIVKFKYNPDIIAEVKKIGGGKWNPVEKYWYFPTEKKEALEKLASKYNLNDEEIWTKISNLEGNEEQPEYPTLWNYSKRQYVKGYVLRNGKINSCYFGERINYSSSGKNADYEYYEDEKPENLRDGELILIHAGSHRHPSYTYFQKRDGKWYKLDMPAEIDTYLNR
jgi:hypothetical protein